MEEGSGDDVGKAVGVHGERGRRRRRHAELAPADTRRHLKLVGVI